jgi:membrane dipeptidase
MGCCGSGFTFLGGEEGKAGGGVVGVMFQPVHLQFKVDDNQKPDKNVSINEIVKHIRYIADRIGVEHVALGSDFDGAEIPKELKDAAGLPKLIDALRESGYSDNAIEKIAYKNWLRVIKETWINQ